MTSKRRFRNTRQTNDYGTNYHTKWRPVCGATQTGKKKLFASIITDRSQAPIKRSPLYERLSENLSFAKLRSAVISSSSSAMLVGHSDYLGRMKRLSAR